MIGLRTHSPSLTWMYSCNQQRIALLKYICALTISECYLACYATESDALAFIEASESTRPSSYVEGHDEHGDHEVGCCQAGDEHVRHVDWSRENSKDGDENQEVACNTPNIGHVIYVCIHFWHETNISDVT